MTRIKITWIHEGFCYYFSQVCFNPHNYMMKCVSNPDNGISYYTVALESIHTPSLFAHFIVSMWISHLPQNSDPLFSILWQQLWQKLQHTVRLFEERLWTSEGLFTDVFWGSCPSFSWDIKGNRALSFAVYFRVVVILNGKHSPFLQDPVCIHTHTTPPIPAAPP